MVYFKENPNLKWWLGVAPFQATQKYVVHLPDTVATAPTAATAGTLWWSRRSGSGVHHKTWQVQSGAFLSHRGHPIFLSIFCGIFQHKPSNLGVFLHFRVSTIWLILWMGQRNSQLIDSHIIQHPMFFLWFIGFQPSKVMQDFASIHSM